MKSGRTVVGRFVGRADGQLEVATNPMKPEQITRVPADKVKSKRPADVSLMPPGLLNRLSKKEALDLMAYLLSGGNKQSQYFKE
jgi:hypothetical protein